MADVDAIELLIEPRERPVGTGTVRRLLPFRRRRMVGPFIFCDVMGPEELAPGIGMNVDAHPHIGLSTLTYLLRGRAVHRDSTGAVQTIEARAVNWMTAGSGVAHTERSHPDDVDASSELFGIQTWVALPTDDEETAPRFEHCDAADVPTEEQIQGSGRVVLRMAAGSAFGMSAPVTGSSPLMLADAALDDAELTIGNEHPERAVLALGDGLQLGGRPLADATLAVLDPGSTPTLSGSGRAILLGGDPLGRRHIWWNFVHSDPDRIEHAKDDWAARRFPTVPDDHDPWVALPR
ncbi:MAG: pirin family protein [Actinomycetota bacterium]